MITQENRQDKTFPQLKKNSDSIFHFKFELYPHRDKKSWAILTVLAISCPFKGKHCSTIALAWNCSFWEAWKRLLFQISPKSFLSLFFIVSKYQLIVFIRKILSIRKRTQKQHRNNFLLQPGYDPKLNINH